MLAYKIVMLPGNVLMGACPIAILTMKIVIAGLTITNLWGNIIMAAVALTKARL